MKKFNFNDLRRIIKIYVAIIIPILIVTISIYNYLSKSEIEKTKEILTEVQKQKAKTIQYINVENGEIETPYKPTIRICVPIYSSKIYIRGF